MTIETTIQQLTGKFLNSLSQTLAKERTSSEILMDPSLHIMLHIISCVQSLRDKFNYTEKSKYSISAQLFQPFLNGMLALFGKVLMDSFTSEPKLSDIENFTQGFGIVSKHILNLFPEMATKKHKTSGKMLIHHAVFKARPAIAEETVRQILVIHPDSARAKDSTGALPLHWATRNEEIAVEVLDILIKQYPESPSVVDSKGFVPLHWAVNQDNPHIEVVRKLLKSHPQGASVAANNGYLPLHYCVLRDKPSSAAIKALMQAHPEGIKSKCIEGNLPLHIYLHRENVDLEIVKLLINYYPEGLKTSNKRNQLPLHIALDVPVPNLPSLQMLLQEYPEGAQAQDVDGYLPLHLSIDNAYPNYPLANHILQSFPAAAQYTTRDGMLPLHLIVSTNHNPPAPFVNAVITAFPEGINVPVTDVVPAVDMSMSEPESWSGEWCEKQWTPLSKAKDRNMDNSVLNVFYKFGNLIKNDPKKYRGQVIPYAGVGAVEEWEDERDVALGVRASQPLRVVENHNNSGFNLNVNSSTLFGGKGLSTPPAAVAPLNAPKPSVDPFENQLQDVSSNSVTTAPVRHQPIPDDYSVMSGVDSVQVDNFTRPLSASNQSVGSGVTVPAKPTGKLPPNILKAQLKASQQQAGHNRDPSPQGVKFPQIVVDNSPYSTAPSTAAAAVGNNNRDVSPGVPGMRAPPQGPIPQSLLMAAENNALRYSKVLQGGGAAVMGVKKSTAAAAGLTPLTGSSQNMTTAGAAAASGNPMDTNTSMGTNNRRYLVKVSPQNAAPTVTATAAGVSPATNNGMSASNSAYDLNGPDTRSTTAEGPRTEGLVTDSLVEVKARKLLQAQQVYLKRGANNVLNSNNNVALLSATQPLQGGGGGTAAAAVGGGGMNQTIPNNKVYLKPSGAGGATNNTNEVIKNLGVGKVRPNYGIGGGGGSNDVAEIV